MFTGPTHIPRSTASKTKAISAAQLDYIICQTSSTKYPKGKSKVIIGLEKADHYALSTIINVPNFVPKSITFSPNFRTVEPDYALVDKTLQNLLEHEPINEATADTDFQQIDNLKHILLEETSTVRKISVPNNLSNPFLIRLTILQDKGNKYRKNGDIKRFHEIENQIRATICDYMVAESENASQDMSSSLFHRFADSLAKPMKCDFGKNVMNDRSIEEMATEINNTYFDPNPDDWTTKIPVSESDKSLLLEALYKHDFIEAVENTLKPPKDFKAMKRFEALLCYQLTKSIINTGSYPISLKISRCTILPSRSIFSAYHTESKVVERFFCTLFEDEVEELQNVAYRKNLSCTSLLASQFNAFAIEPTVFSYNADIKKAFNSMSRRSVLDSFKNSHLRNIISDWMDRSWSPYLINWGNSYQEISREIWSSGLEPGSNLGPPLFLKGLKCKDKIYLRAIPGQKNLFSDDGAPLYRAFSTLVSDAVDYIRHTTNLHMKLHNSGDKAMAYMAIGRIDSDLGDVEVQVDNVTYKISRTYATRQLGLFYSVDKSGKYLVSIAHYITKLKNAYFALVFAAKFLPSSVLIIIIKQYLMSVVSYGILIWYPVLWFHKHQDLDSLRYWYTSLQALASAGCRDVMSWSNRTKTLKVGSSLESVCAELTGIPTLEELYLTSAASHYPQLLKMHDLGFLGPSVKLNKRLYFVGTTLRGRISPFEPLFFSINNLIDQDLTKVRGDLKTTSYLKQLEKDKNLDSKLVRTFQKAVSLASFGILHTERSRNKFSAQELKFLDSKSEEIKLSASSLKTLVDSRKIIQQHVAKLPPSFTAESSQKFGNKSKYRELKERDTC